MNNTDIVKKLKIRANDITEDDAKLLQEAAEIILMLRKMVVEAEQRIDKHREIERVRQELQDIQALPSSKGIFYYDLSKMPPIKAQNFLKSMLAKLQQKKPYGR